MLRAKTAKAAGRRYAKCIPYQIASAEYETDNCNSPTYHKEITPDMLRHFKAAGRNVDVIVEKD
jgi:hypothetical protein